MSIQEWNEYYNKVMRWQTVVEGDYIYILTDPNIVSALEFHHQYEIYERFVKWDKLAKLEYHDDLYVTINDHKALLFVFRDSTIEQIKNKKSCDEFINYNDSGYLHWTLHNVGGKLPVEPSPGCKWPVERNQLLNYSLKKLQQKEARADVIFASFFEGKLYEGDNKEGNLV